MKDAENNTIQPPKRLKRTNKVKYEGEPTNAVRAEWAQVAINAYRAEVGTDEEDALCDLLADLMHWSDKNEQSFYDQQDRARRHYLAELFEEQAPTDEVKKNRQYCHDPKHGTPCPTPCAGCALECDPKQTY